MPTTQVEDVKDVKDPVSDADLQPVSAQLVRLLPSDPRDMVPSAVRWAYTVQAAIRDVPLAAMRRTSRPSLHAVVWVLAAAADFDDRIPADHTAELLAREAGVGERTWQKRTAWLRGCGWLQHGPGGQWDGWVLAVPASQGSVGSSGSS